jgi:prepilin-type N-terminal cleavage/methylation domain-containing protein
MVVAHMRHLPRPARGFSMVEMAVVLAVAAVLTWAVSAAYGNVVQTRDRVRAQELAETLRDKLRAHALLHARLPCPDTTGSGWEGDAVGTCATSTVVGGFPYRTLGLDLPADAFRATYAVYRHAVAPDTADADLAVRKERTGDLAGGSGYQGVHDLVVALNNAASETATPVAGRTGHTGDGGVQGAVDCAGNLRANVAFWLVLPLEDRDGNGLRLDGVHNPGAVCAAAAGLPASHTQDDVVVLEPFSVLAGWLNARAL